MTSLTLPQPARNIWGAHIRTIKELVGQTNPNARLLMGGGTVLAARWKHRLSMDIDLVLPEIEDLNDWMVGRQLDITARTGGELMKTDPTHITVALEHGVLDIACFDPRPPGLELEQDVMGESCHVMSNTQILRGKIERTRTRPTRRDGYDLGVAARVDATAVAEAVNAVPGHAIMKCIQNMAEHKEGLDDDAKQTLKGVPSEYQDIAEDVRRHMAAAITGALYTGIQIDVEGDTTRVRRKTVREELPPREFGNQTPPGEVLARTALDSHLRYNPTWNETTKSVIAKIERARTGERNIAVALGGFASGPGGTDGQSGGHGRRAIPRGIERPKGPGQSR